MMPRAPARYHAAMADALTALWTLDPEVTFLNHGSFGACPKPVLAAQDEWRARMERDPMRFFLRDYERLLDDARAAVATFVGADADDLAFIPNATYGTNVVLASLELAPGDEVLRTNHGYNAVNNTIDEACARTGAVVRVAEVPWPSQGNDEVVAAILAQVTPRTRLAVLDHITSPTGLVLPIERLVEVLAIRGVDTLVDAAHAPGQVPVDLRELDAAYVVANFHKWCCAPKGAAMLWVRRDRQDRIKPLQVSHGRNSRRPDRSRFRLDFDWTGTHDPSPALCVPTALRTLERAVPGGWPVIRGLNHALALAARRVLCEVLRIPPPCPDDMLGAMAAVPLPVGTGSTAASWFRTDGLQDLLFDRYGIQVPILLWPAPPARQLRISAQLYNHPNDYARLAAALEVELGL